MYVIFIIDFISFRDFKTANITPIATATIKSSYTVTNRTIIKTIKSVFGSFLIIGNIL